MLICPGTGSNEHARRLTILCEPLGQMAETSLPSAQRGKTFAEGRGPATAIARSRRRTRTRACSDFYMGMGLIFRWVVWRQNPCSETKPLRD